jgi:autotransporter-associated beta strand protein
MKKLRHFVLVTSLLAGMLHATTSRAQNGTWINPNGGSWANPANWQGGVIANGTDNTADFSTLSLSADATVTLDGAQTIGNLIFGDQAGAHNWFLNTGTGGPLTLSVSANPAATITVNNQTATIGLALAGTPGLIQNGNGTLVLVQPIGYDGGTTNNAGTLELVGSLSVNEYIPLAITGIVESAGTLNFDVATSWNYNDGGSTNAIGEGTLRLTATANGSSSPDLFFAPDAVANDYYGAAIAMGTLDLGASQRYIFALTEHNAVAEYDPYEDARIDGNIIGAGGITYIAQNSYGGDEPMECPLVLAGANTFTGEVEIQRGSIYLFNPSALAQTNKLLMDPAAGNNARLFVYGNGATVANLESSGLGTPLIANGNVHNYFADTPPAILTVNETSNTVFGGALVDTQAEYDGGPFTCGPLSLVVNGPGILTLSGANTYSGSTAVNGGGLVVSTLATGGGSFSFTDGTTLGIDVTSANTLPMSALTLGSNASTTVEFSFSGIPSATVAPVTAASLTANGGANAVTINIYLNGGVAAGQFPLIQYASGSISGTGFSAFKLGTVPSYATATLVNNAANNSIDLNITAVAEPEWSGLLSSEWSTNKLPLPKNWVFITDGKTPTDYTDGNSVLFNDVATGTTTVNVSVANVSPASVIFNNSVNNYTLTGSMAIAGATGLTKTGSGSLTIQNTNIFTGQVAISGGTVIINSDANLGAVPSAPTPDAIVLNGATLSAAATATLAANRGLALGPASGTGGGALNVAGEAILTVTGAVANNGTSTASLDKTGAGQLILAGTDTYSGGTSNESGTMTFLQSQTFSAGSALGIAPGAIVQSSGTISLIADGSINPVIGVVGAGTLELTSSNNSATSPDIYFNANDTPNSTANWGTRIGCPINLGSAQRFIWGNTDHNGVGEYGLTEADCQFAGPISGAGGMTFIAQDSHTTGSSPMETPFCLNAPNSFTGPVQLQRGSIYLGDPNAFPPGDVLEINVGSTNNGRFFLYGNDVTASDLESTNTGNAIIADGNVIPDLVGPATLTIIQNNPKTFNGAIQDVQPEYGGGGGLTPTLSLVKSGPATLTLSGNNTYSGATTISTGTLALGSGGTLATTSPISITPGAVLDVTATSFTLGAQGPQTLVAGRTSNFGTDVNGSMTSQGTVNVAGTGIAGTLTINGDLSLQGGNLLMDLAGTSTKGAGVNDLISVSGALNLNGPTTITPNFLTGGLGAGPYTLIQAASLNGNPNNLTLVTFTGGRQSYALDTTTTPGSVLLQVGGSSPASLVWLGTNSSVWDTKTTVNWLNGTVADVFYTGDSVTFNDTATNGIVKLTGSLEPFSVAVTNNVTSYVFEGSGGITGPATLTKSGKGTLVVLNSNTYSGLTLITGGTLQVDTNGTTGSLGGGPVSNNATLIFDRSDIVDLTNTISGTGALEQIGTGTLVLLTNENYSGPTVITKGTLQVGNDATYGTLGTGPVTDNSVLILDRSDTLTLNNNIAGSGLITNFDGNIFLGGASTYSGGTYIEGGTVVAASPTALGIGLVTIDTGALGPGALYFLFPSGTTNVVANNIILPGNGGGLIQEFLLEGNPTNSTTVRLTGVISGGDGETYRLADTGVSGNHYDVIELANPSNSFSGNIQLWRGSIGFTSDGALGNTNNPIEIDLGSTNGALRFDANNITLSPSRIITLDSGYIEPINVQSFTGTIPGDITGSGPLAKLGNGTLILPGTYDYSGTVAIYGGALMVNGLVESTAMMEVTNGATLDGIGTVTGPVTVDGTVAPGTNSVGTLTTGGEIWDANGSMIFSLNNGTNSAGWSLLNITAGLDVTAKSAAPFTIKLVSLTSSNTPGPITGFNPAASNTWTIATTASGFTNFEAFDFVVDTTAFANPLAGVFRVATNGNSLVLNYAVAPRPLTLSGIQRLANGTFDLSLTGTIGTGFTVHATTNLALLPLSAWTVLGTGTLGAGTTTFDDLTSTNFLDRFYIISTP